MNNIPVVRSFPGLHSLPDLCEQIIDSYSESGAMWCTYSWKQVAFVLICVDIFCSLIKDWVSLGGPGWPGLTVNTTLALFSQRPACLCLPHAETKGMHFHTGTLQISQVGCVCLCLITAEINNKPSALLEVRLGPVHGRQVFFYAISQVYNLQF